MKTNKYKLSICFDFSPGRGGDEANGAMEDFKYFTILNPRC